MFHSMIKSVVVVVLRYIDFSVYWGDFFVVVSLTVLVFKPYIMFFFSLSVFINRQRLDFLLVSSYVDHHHHFVSKLNVRKEKSHIYNAYCMYICLYIEKSK